MRPLTGAERIDSMAANRILVVEDDASISSAVALNLRFAGYEYRVFDDGAQAAEGVRMILASVPDILGKMNITSFGAPGEPFDPNLHNAVMHVDDEQYGDGEILEVFQCGYRRGDKILRYAMVKTAN